MVERLRIRTEPIIASESIEGWKAIEIRECNEPLVNLTDVPQVLVDAQYLKQGIQGSREEVFLRLGVVDRLITATRYLPKGYKLLIWDGWRPLEVQQALFDEFSVRAATAYFEGKMDLTKQERNFRDNRRILFHTLTRVGFTNYREEWCISITATNFGRFKIEN